MPKHIKKYVAVLTLMTCLVILVGTQLTYLYFDGRVVKLVDALALEASAARHESSNLSLATIPYTFKDIAIDIAFREGVDPELLLAVIEQESRWNPTARSKKGAYGFMQLMPNTAKELGVDRYQLVSNLVGGARYLKQQLDKYDGNVKLALYAYNGGSGNVDRGRIYREMRQYASAIMSDLE
jgi:soluble lytic murein transglycosylase-like protein